PNALPADPKSVLDSHLQGKVLLRGISARTTDKDMCEDRGTMQKAPMTRLCAGLAFTLVFLTLPFAPTPALAQSWPSKPLRLVVPFGAGGAVDVLARLLRAKVARQPRQPA